IGACRTGEFSDAARTGGQREPEAVQLDDCGDEAQAKAHSKSIAALVGTVEAPHDRIPFVFSNSWPRVRDPDNAFVGAGYQLKTDGSSLRRDFDGVIDQICYRLEQQAAIAADLCIVLSGDAESD